ncbi:2OG-Fe(II) oxygenase [Massilia sp. CF038]|uniref:2OG-Fe(II) oxygenase n=1 Tax=Massilia sp. CF038 TaxID=1881045 RepID=UPI0009104E75|nr:2OG-Fe(II) oxygenase [Massilia sp. CF038]SHH70113.1 Predicted 2-oxoglutarate-and Fe(II)-dependent dioxygenase YbiX [Massilia sp. CF038]
MTTALHVTRLDSGVITIENFLTAAECQRYIDHGETIGYVPSEVNLPGGSRRAEEIRNNDRVLYDDPTLASRLFERARPLLPEQIGDCRLHGFNERMRFYRYGPNEYFKWHRDGSFAPSPEVASLLTFMIYLNDGFEGGDTEFKSGVVTPAAGMALIFPHRLLHQGAAVCSGTKYVLRTDVMYRQ